MNFADESKRIIFHLRIEASNKNIILEELCSRKNAMVSSNLVQFFNNKKIETKYNTFLL